MHLKGQGRKLLRIWMQSLTGTYSTSRDLPCLPQALADHQYDGHVLDSSLKRAEAIAQTSIEQAFVDKGYKGHGITDKQVYISGQKRGMTRTLKKHLKRRSAIEPHIGHMKSDGKLKRNYLKGTLGDTLNALLCAIGHNMRMIWRKIRSLFVLIWNLLLQQPGNQKYFESQDNSCLIVFFRID